jgi:hypothetical protein
MSRSHALLAVAALSLFATTPAFAGPPWLSLEIPANPYTDATRGAYALVRVYHHGDAAYYPVSGTAEGLVNGQRRSVTLKFVTTSLPGVYALRYEPAKEGAWVLVIHIGQDSDHGQATLLAAIRNGEVGSARVPTRQQGEWTIPDSVTPGQIDDMLRQQLAVVDTTTRATDSPLALAGVALVPLGMLFGIRRR